MRIDEFYLFLPDRGKWDICAGRLDINNQEVLSEGDEEEERWIREEGI